jgi:hypothetical protein
MLWQYVRVERRVPYRLPMRPRPSYVLLFAAILFLGMALFFLVSASLTQINCCEASWVDNAPNAATHNARQQLRDRSLAEVARQKLQLRIYALFSLAAAAGLVFVYRRRRTRRVRRYYVSADSPSEEKPQRHSG